MEYYIDPVTQEIYAYTADEVKNGWLKPGLETITKAEIDELRKPPIDELRKIKRAEINAARTAVNAGIFTHAGLVFSCDPLSRSDIDALNGYVALNGDFPPQFSQSWRAVDNAELTLPDVSAWKSFYAAMVAAGLSNFAHSKQLKEALIQAETIEQIEAISTSIPTT